MGAPAMRIRILIAAVFLVALAARAGQIPRPAPPFEVATLRGEKISLQSLRGKVVLLKFFLTECTHCQRSAGNVMPIYKEWRGRGLEVLSVAINPDARLRIPDFVRRFGVAYPIGLGDSAMVNSFAQLPVVARFSVPYMFLIDRRGVVRFEHPGGDQNFFGNEAKNLRLELDLLLKEPAAGRTTSKRAPKS